MRRFCAPPAVVDTRYPASIGTFEIGQRVTRLNWLALLSAPVQLEIRVSALCHDRFNPAPGHHVNQSLSLTANSRTTARYPFLLCRVPSNRVPEQRLMRRLQGNLVVNLSSASIRYVGAPN